MSSTVNDFDFIIGTWRVEHRRLKQRLVGCDEWEEFGGTCTSYKILGGAGNVDDCHWYLPGGSYRAAAFRSFDEQTRSWAIWWLDSRDPHTIDVPVTGGFIDGTGVFYANETLDGQPILVRFRWLDTDGPVPHWDQAFSVDDGASWEINWTNSFHRVDPA